MIGSSRRPTSHRKQSFVPRIMFTWAVCTLGRIQFVMRQLILLSLCFSASALATVSGDLVFLDASGACLRSVTMTKTV